MYMVAYVCLQMRLFGMFVNELKISYKFALPVKLTLN